MGSNFTVSLWNKFITHVLRMTEKSYCQGLNVAQQLSWPLRHLNVITSQMNVWNQIILSEI